MCSHHTKYSEALAAKIKAENKALVNTKEQLLIVTTFMHHRVEMTATLNALSTKLKKTEAKLAEIEAEKATMQETLGW